MNNKTNLRATAKKLRASLDISYISKIICERITKHEAFISSTNIMLYYPTASEIDILPLSQISGKNFYLPRVNGKMLDVCRFTPNTEFTKSSYGIFEPVDDAVENSILDLVITPALMVDKNNYRLGYGGGYYDRFLKTCRAKTICPIHSLLIVENIFPEIYDIPIDYIVCE